MFCPVSLASQLYEEEEWQLGEIAEAQKKSSLQMRYGEIFGAEHLLRLLATCLPALVSETSADTDTCKIIRSNTESLLRYLDENADVFFAGQKYLTMEQRTCDEVPDI